MFAVEIDFQDGVSPPEILLVRRPHVIVGASERAHVLIEGAATTLYELRLTRGIGAEFRCQPISRSDNAPSMPPFLEGTYKEEAGISLGQVSTHITALDIDLILHSGESPDRAGVRVMQAALSQASPTFPAVAVLGAYPTFVSFPSVEVVAVGRSRKCAVRLDSSDVSSEHCQIGFDGGNFWVEDLGSTNGTLVNGERVSGRQVLEPGEVVNIGAEFSIVGVSNQDQLADIGAKAPEPVQNLIASTKTYPSVVSNSDLVRPPRLGLARGAVVKVGRDPANDIWVEAAHVSREHAEIVCDQDGVVFVIDNSSNGTHVNSERLARGAPLEIRGGCPEIDLGGNVSLTVCLSEEEELRYTGVEAAESANGEVEAVSAQSLSQRPPGGSLGASSALRQALGGGEEQSSNPARSAAGIGGAGGSVFERLAERASTNTPLVGSGEPIAPFVPSEEEQKSFSEEEDDDNSASLEGFGDTSYSPKGKLNKFVLGLVVLLIMICALLVFVWFLGFESFSNF